MGWLEAKVALVTGGGRGIGAAIAQKLASLGGNIIVCGRTLARLQHLNALIAVEGGDARTVAADYLAAEGFLK